MAQISSSNKMTDSAYQQSETISNMYIQLSYIKATMSWS